MEYLFLRQNTSSEAIPKDANVIALSMVALTFELTGVQMQSEASLLNVRVERFVGRHCTNREEVRWL